MAIKCCPAVLFQSVTVSLVTMLKCLRPHHHPLPSHITFYPRTLLPPSPFILTHSFHHHTITLYPPSHTPSTLHPYTITFYPSTIHPLPLHTPSTLHHHSLSSHTPPLSTLTGWYNDITECTCLNPGSGQPSLWALQHQKISRSKHPAPCSSPLSI